MTSLKKQLIFWLVGLLTVVGLVAGTLSYLLAYNDAGRFLDHQLRQVALSIDEGSQLPSMQAKYFRESEAERSSDFVIQVWYENYPVRSSRPDFDLPRAQRQGYSDMHTKSGAWRAYTLIYPNRTVQVSQASEVRRRSAEEAAMRALLPVAGLIPLSWVLVAFGVSHILKPIAAVTRAATERDASSLEPLPLEKIPDEVSPLIVEMNGLLSRLGDALESQRKFVSDAAHELRTPLAALQLQIENVKQGGAKEEFESRVDELRSGVERASRLVGQLLKMARFEAQNEIRREELDLGEVLKSCLGDFIPIAERKGIDLGMESFSEVKVTANERDLRTLFDNLLDNAIRYTPTGGKVDVSLGAASGRAIVEIADNGPGIPEALLPRVFDRFFRAGGQDTEGSGIGLAIVKAIAAKEFAEIELGNRKEGTGLIARVSFGIGLS